VKPTTENVTDALPFWTPAFVALQYLLPRYWLTALVFRLARVRHVAIKDFLIRQFVRFYDVNVEEAGKDVPAGYADFNAFFTRQLSDNSRQVDVSESNIVSPADGTLSAAGQIRHDQIFQAKGRDYSLLDLLATNTDEADQFIDGSFATVYLAPYNYHRVHAPMDGELVMARYVPGDLFSVNAMTASGVPRLFARNERLICHLRTAVGPLVVILVGALNVGSITTPWSGEIRPRKSGVVEEIELGSSVPKTLRKGDLLGWFNMGSTVIMLLPPHRCRWAAHLATGRTLLMGEAIGELSATK
jgi:phosphatidylserine decarboxylase